MSKSPSDKTSVKKADNKAEKPSETPAGPYRTSDILSIAKLATQATTSVTRIVEEVQNSILNTPGVPGSEVIRSISKLVYKSVHGATFVVGKGVDLALTHLQPQLQSAADERPGTPRREAFLAALNGVMGDRLVADNNPFAIPMTFHCGGQTLDLNDLSQFPQAGARVCLLIHGLCMNDLKWRVESEARVHDHGETLASALGCTSVYLRYNSGLHTSINGRELSAQLEKLFKQWPVRIEELSIVAHSMGGLLARSAVHYAGEDDMHWVNKLKNMVFLGTPHHGAPLEQAGNWLGVILGGTSYGAPFTRLLQLRSSGITDLRYGHVLDQDWQDHDRFKPTTDKRKAVPLPANVACYTVAATTASKRSALADRLIGDGLVPLPSALGQHDDAQHKLAFAQQSQWVAYRTNHMELLGSTAVSNQMIKWLMASPD